MQIEKTYDDAGKLTWAKGKAREVFQDDDVRNQSRNLYRRFEVDDRWYRHLEPRHLCEEVLGEDDTLIKEASNGSIDWDATFTAVPPFEQWTFVLYSRILPLRNFEEENYVAREISGDELVEVVVAEESLLKNMILSRQV